MEPPINGNHYRLVSRSGRQPNNDGPAQDRIARETLLSIYRCIPPWTITRIAPDKRILSAAPPLYSHFDIDCSDLATRRVWERVPSRRARKWGAMARNLKQVTVRYPRGYHFGAGDEWCECAWASLIEAHATAREANNEKPDKAKGGGAQPPAGDQQGGSLHTITFEPVDLSDEEFRALNWQQRRSLMSRLPKTVILSGLKTIRGLGRPQCTLIDERQWSMPSLEHVEGYACGDFIGTSSSLTHLEVRPIRGLLDVPGRMSPPVVGQRGNLEGLQKIGVIQPFRELEMDLDRLKEALARHKIRRIRDIKADAPDVFGTGILVTSELLRLARTLADFKQSLAPATLTRTAFTSVPEIVLVSRNWNKTLKLDFPLPPPSAPLPSLFSNAMKYFASRAKTVIWDTDPAPIEPSEPDNRIELEKELMADLMFNKATTVDVRGGGFAAALGAVSPDTFPAVTHLDIRGGWDTAASTLAAKMPRLRLVEMTGSGAGGAMAFLRSMGRERRLPRVVIMGVPPVTWLGWGDQRDDLPEIEELKVTTGGFGPPSEDSAIRAVESLLQLRVSREVRIVVQCTTSQEVTLQALNGRFPGGSGEANGFSVTWEATRYDIMVVARRIDT
ncbi:unnamed protein product [Vitrella brassicaformis CCMP3155]|uniref:Uncharacterized protein n=1 Tax=Vitrella brassicaformis (strain CCMP3155) TaxID=1169540 RepID=A0A0G4F7R6_VITBC|nr:unnamed protein product [Vitrella brassicaformis CCMP3155]|eukprot:CEM08042.1 unnamed protein product [Vitrella brassicaformis CCMP3155]